MQMEELPNPIMLNEEIAIIVCPKCGAINFGARPHGEEPCPFAILEMAANRDMLEARRAYYERASFASIDMVAVMQQLTSRLLDDDEDET